MTAARKKKQPPKIFRPCDDCVHADSCGSHNGCYAWKAWFRAYWRALRRKYLHGIEEF